MESLKGDKHFSLNFSLYTGQSKLVTTNKNTQATQQGSVVCFPHSWSPALTLRPKADLLLEGHYFNRNFCLLSSFPT